MMRALAPFLIRVALAALVLGWQLARQETLANLYVAIAAIGAAATLGWSLKGLAETLLQELQPKTRADRRAMRKITELVHSRTGAANNTPDSRTT